MSENPDVIRSDIEQTRRRLGTNVDAVADKVTPSHVVRRQTDKVRDAVFGVKDKVMGAAEEAGDNLGSAMDDAGAAVTDMPHKVARQAQGNPLAAGLVAFGAGMLLSSLIPASEKEQQAATALKDAAQPLTEEAASAAKTVAQGLQEPAREAMENVKATATESAQHLKTEGQTAVSDVKDTAQDAKDRIQPS
ncbi:DUF3618 domain-containing protein [bacterium RCC_150]